MAGKRVGISLQRSTRGREILSTRAFYELITGRVTSAKRFLQSMSVVEFSCNWFYADNRDIAFFSSGRLPQRAAVMDAAWPELADAVLGPLVDRLAALTGRSDAAWPGGSAYNSGWYGYVDKDLRMLLGRPVRAEFARR